MTFAKRVFWWSGLYGVIALLPQYFMEAKVGHDFPPAISHPEYFYGFIGVGLAWQILFFVIAKDPARYRGAMIPGALEKIGFGFAAIALFLQGRLAAPVVALGGLDLVMAALFFMAYVKTPAMNS